MWPRQTMAQLALLDGESVWLTSTVIGLVIVVLLGLAASLYLYAGRRFHWLSHGEYLRLKRTLHVAFGALFLAAATLPYLVSKAPLLAMTGIILALLALLPFAVMDSSEERAGDAVGLDSSDLEP